MIKENDKTRDIGFADYYRFVRDGIDQGDLKWGRDNLVLAFLFPLVPIALGAIFYGIYPDPRPLVLALWAYAVALSLFVLLLLARAPWKHHRQVVARYHEQLA